MADDGLFFRRVASVHPRFGTPYVSILLATGLGIVFVLLRTFEQLADIFVTAIVPFYALAVASIFVLRRRAGYSSALPRAGLSGRARAVHPRDAVPARQRDRRSDEPVAERSRCSESSCSGSPCTT